jgi:hypothetical protein
MGPAAKSREETPVRAAVARLPQGTAKLLADLKKTSLQWGQRVFFAY